MRARGYHYVGPADIRAWAVAPDTVVVDSAVALERWLAARDRRDLGEPFTFVVALDGVLRLALAGGADVLAAGEMGFVPAASGWRVVTVTNQSTGYCPDPGCWPAVAAALDRVGVPHPGDLTDPIVFRLCPACAERNVVRDEDFTCALCGSALERQTPKRA